MLLNFTKCSVCSGLRNTSELCCSLPAEETKLNQACGKKLKKRGQPSPFPWLLVFPQQNSTCLLQGHSVYSNSNKPDLLTTNQHQMGQTLKKLHKGGQDRTGMHARGETRGTAKCQNP